MNARTTSGREVENDGQREKKIKEKKMKNEHGYIYIFMER